MQRRARAQSALLAYDHECGDNDGEYTVRKDAKVNGRKMLATGVRARHHFLLDVTPGDIAGQQTSEAERKLRHRPLFTF